MNPAQILTHFDRIGEAPHAIPRLRRFILDLAVRGKLVEQDPRDEPASELLKRIDAEKASFIKRGKIQKQPLIEDLDESDLPFELPQGWLWSRLGNIADWGSGSTPPRGNSEYYGGDVTWLKSGELGDCLALKGSEEKVTDSALKKCSFRLNQPGDVLIAMYGATIGKLAILSEPAVTNQAVCGCTPFGGILNRYLFIFLLSRRANFHSQSEGGAQPNISKVKIVLSPFALPPLAEQHRIVAKVDELMALCDRFEAAQTERESRRDRLVASSLHRLNNGADADAFREHARFYFNHLPRLTTRHDHIKQLRQTILNLAVRGKLVEQDPTDEPASELLKRIQKVKTQLLETKILRSSTSATNSIDNRHELPIPPTWSWAKCEEILFVTKLAGFEYTKYFNLTKEGETPVIRAQNVRSGKIDKTNILYINQKTSEILSRSALTKPCMLMTFIGAGIGDVALFNEKLRWHLAPNVAKIEEFPGCDDQLDLSYLVLLMNSPFGKGEIFKHMKATAQPSISMGTIRDIDMPLPPLAEQHRIVAKVDELMALCDQLETQLTTTQTESRRLLQAVLHQALNTTLEKIA